MHFPVVLSFRFSLGFCWLGFDLMDACACRFLDPQVGEGWCSLGPAEIAPRSRWYVKFHPIAILRVFFSGSPMRVFPRCLHCVVGDLASWLRVVEELGY